ncbi:MAG: hypothetical protein N2515_02365 [Deltaproteobacteria bacterium]|nr:hypothetical protein [Deltaproteobacteria bacterium]
MQRLISPREALIALALTTGCASKAAPAFCDEIEASIGSKTIGEIRIVQKSKILFVEGIQSPSRWLFAKGNGGILPPDWTKALMVDGSYPHGVIIVGDLGHNQKALAWLSALAALSIPAFLLPGPRDALFEIRKKIRDLGEEGKSLILLSGIERLRIGKVEFLIVPRPVESEPPWPGICQLRKPFALPEPSTGVFSVLLGFEAPQGTPLTRGLGGVEVGSKLIHDWMVNKRVFWGIFAGPEPTRGCAPWPLPDGSSGGIAILARLAEPVTETIDGHFVPSPCLLVEIDERGLRSCNHSLGADNSQKLP